MYFICYTSRFKSKLPRQPAFSTATSLVGEGLGKVSRVAVVGQGSRADSIGLVQVHQVGAGSVVAVAVPICVGERGEAKVGEARQAMVGGLVHPLNVFKAERVISSSLEVPRV